MAANKNQTRVSNLAKDLGMKNKEIIDVLAARGIEGKTHCWSKDGISVISRRKTASTGRAMRGRKAPRR